MNKAAGQNPQIISKRNKCRDDLDPEKLEWVIWLSHIWKWYFTVNRHSDLNSTQRHQKKSKSRETEKNRLSHLIIGGMHTGGTSPGRKDQDGLGMMKSEGFQPMISNTCRSNHSVCDGGCTHTLLSHADFLCVTYRHRVHAWPKCL